MKKIITFTSLALVVLLGVLLFGVYLAEKPSYLKSVTVTEIYSEVLKENRELIIHLPRNYNPDLKYPVMYVLDGSSQDFHLANKLHVLADAGFVPETIVVGLPNVNGVGRQRDYTPPKMRMDIDSTDSSLGEADNFLTFMEQELFTYISQNYAVSNHRLLVGHSRGGLMVLYSLLYKPELFSARFMFSPAFWRDDDFIVKQTDKYFASKPNIKSFVFMSLGDDENNKMKQGYDKMIEVFKRQAPQNLIWYAHTTKNSTHSNNAQNSAALALAKWSDYLTHN